MVDIVIEGRARNALSTDVMHKLVAAIDAAGGEPLHVRGAGGAFSAGLDLREVVSLSMAGMAGFLRLLERLFTSLYQYPAPTVALVNGHAIAGGCILALCCDYRVAAADPSAKIGLNEAAIGVVFPPRTLAIARARVSRRHATDILLGAAPHDPEGARAIGLVDEVAADAEAVARRKLAALSAHPRGAYARIKRDLRGATPDALASDDALDRYLADSVPIWTGGEVKERVAKVLGK